MSKELKAFRKICRCLSSSYEFTDEYKKNKKLVETALKEKAQQDNLIKIIKETIEFGIKDNKVDVSEEGDVSIVGTIGLILRKELDKKERTLFRNWILETCFPKELKALEIIKEKQVNIAALLELDSLQQYNNYCDMVGGCKKLTQEEYDLLKKVLKDE